MGNFFQYVRLLLLVLLVTTFVGCTGTLVTSRSPTPLDQQTSEAKVLAAEEIVVDPMALRFSRLKLDALDVSLELEGTAGWGKLSVSHVWSGHVAGDELSHAVFASYGTAVFGFVRTSSGLVLELRPMASGSHVIRQLDGNTFTPEALPADQSSALTAAASSCTLPQNEIVNVAIYYTDRARTVLDGDEPMLAAIEASILSANQVYVDSQVRVRLNLVHAAAVSYTEANAEATLAALTRNGDGFLDDVHTQRNLVAADVVVLVAVTEVCGKANLLITTNGDPNGAFAIVHPNCFVNLGLVHELGHIMGAHHDAAVLPADVKLVYPWARGWVDLQMKRVSIMAYGDACSQAGITDCVGANRFSNPKQLLGDANTADNHRVLNDTASIISSYRCSPMNPITLGSRFISTTMTTDNFGNFWYLDRRQQPIEVVFENIGNSPWDSSYALSLVAPADNLNSSGGPLLDIVRVPLAPGEVINPGQQKTFSFSFTGEGRADEFQWQMTDGSGTPFGDKTPRVTLQPKGF